MSKIITTLLLIFVIFALSGCNSEESAANETAVQAPETSAVETTTESRPMRMGGGDNMMARHHATIPEAYAGLVNLVPADEDSLIRGGGIYEQYCTTCHGDGGMGDGPAGQQLDPPPAPVAHTSRMLGDDYLFWRISEGGGHEPFESAMPRWQDVLEDTDRWDVINYIRALGSGVELPERGPLTGETFDPQAEAARHEKMAADGVAQGVLRQEEADTFVAVHAELDKLMSSMTSNMSGGMDAMQQEMLEELVAGAVITQTDADLFTAAHEKLLASGLMQ